MGDFMWVTVDGERRLGKAEARLLCRAVGSMLTDCVDVIADRSEADQERRVYGIDWFDQWEAEQKVWLMEQVATALLTDQPSLKPAAMWEATVDAIFQRVFEQVVEELECETVEGSEFEHSEIESATAEDVVETGGQRWRDDVIQALKQQQNRVVEIGRSASQAKEWRRLVMQIADRILGVAAYQTAESYRDEQSAKVAAFLQQKGLPDDFLTQIPPFMGQHETKDSIERLRKLIKRFGHCN
ncbi:MAG: hypothetical protein GY924_09145 [Planctomycetaceae bacterium]|nr:hypothetical protein [Planctomycetaceae bacterium]